MYASKGTFARFIWSNSKTRLNQAAVVSKWGVFRNESRCGYFALKIVFTESFSLECVSYASILKVSFSEFGVFSSHSETCIYVGINARNKSIFRTRFEIEMRRKYKYSFSFFLFGFILGIVHFSHRIPIQVLTNLFSGSSMSLGTVQFKRKKKGFYIIFCGFTGPFQYFDIFITQATF